MDTLVPLPASCSLPVLQCVLPLEQSIGRQHHSSVISMETSSSRCNDWAPSQSLPFCDRTMQAVLPTPLLSATLAVWDTHIFPFVLFLHLYGAVTKMGLRSLSTQIVSGWNAFWHNSINKGRRSWRVDMPPTSRPCWEKWDWSGDLLVRSFSCF